MSDQQGDLTAQAEETIADEQEARPDWLPSNFNSPEDLVKSYGELQTKLGSQGTELGSLREQMDEMLELMQQQPAQPQYQDPNQNPLVLEYEDAYQRGDARKMLEVQAQVSQLAAQQLFEQQQKSQGDRTPLDDYQVERLGNEIAQKYNADDEQRAAAMKQIEENPLLQQAYVGVIENPNATLGDLAKVVDTAYQLAGATAMAQEKASLAQQQAEQERGRQRKIDAETLTPSGQTRVAPKSEQEDLWKAIKGSDDGRLIIGER